MRLVEDMLLQLILQGESFTYHCVASRPHVEPHRAAPLIELLTSQIYTQFCTHHHNVGPHVVAITVSSTVVHSATAAPCLLCYCCSYVQLLH